MRAWSAGLLCAAVLCAAVLAGGASAATPPPLTAYGALPAIEEAVLSPDGSRLAFITVIGKDRVLTLQTVGGGKISAFRIGEVKVRDVDFAGDDHLLFTTSLTARPTVPGWRMPRSEWYQVHSYDIRAGKAVTLMSRTQDTLNVVAGPPVSVSGGARPTVLVESVTLVPPSSRNDLYRVNLETGRGDIASEGVRERAMNWVAGPDGSLVARTRYSGERGSWALDVREGNGWRTVDTSRAGLDAPSLLGLGRDGRSVVLWKEADGRESLVELSLIDGKATEIESEFEPDGVVFHPRTRRLAGLAEHTDAGPSVRFFDPQMEKVWAKVTRAFKGKRVSPVSWSDDLNRVLVKTEGRDDPGSVYFVDMKTLRADFVGDMYPGVPGEMIGEVRPVSYKAADGLEIRGFLTLPPGREAKNLPLIVLPHGGPQSADVLAFDWWAQAFASRGYAVLQPNFRGSSGRGMDFVRAGYGEWGRKMQTDLSDGVRWLAGQGTIDPKRVCVMGASYGGYAALAGAAIDRGVYRCAVSVNGVSDLRAMLAAEARSAGGRSAAVKYWNRFMGVQKHTDRALDAVSPARQATGVDIPVLLIHGRDDVVVPHQQSELMERAMKKAGGNVRLVTLDGEDHWLSRPQTRQHMLNEAVAFVEKHNPPG